MEGHADVGRLLSARGSRAENGYLSRPSLKQATQPSDEYTQRRACATNLTYPSQLPRYLGEPYACYFPLRMRKAKAGKLEGRQVAGYNIETYVDSGASADVYRAMRDGRVVALKLYHAWVLEEGDGEARRLEREIESLQKIDHSNVCRFVEASVTEVDGERRPYLAMEYIPGSSLEDLIAQLGPMSWPIFRRHAISILEGITAIHAAGCRHRDLKPANIRMREADETAVIVDFGVVGNIDKTSSDNLTSSSVFLGTLRYAAPEWIFRHPPGAVDKPSVDVYGLGATFYEMATGLRPFPDVENRAALTLAQRDRPLVFDLPNYPSEVVLLLQRMVHKAPESRPSVAEALAILSAMPDDVAIEEGEPLDYLGRLQALLGADEKASKAIDRERERKEVRDAMVNGVNSIISRALERLKNHPLSNLPGLRAFERWEPAVSRWDNQRRLPFIDLGSDPQLIVRGAGCHPFPDADVIGASAIYFLSGTPQRAVIRRVLASEVGRAEGNFFDIDTFCEWEGDLTSVVARAIDELPVVEKQMEQLLYRVNKAKSARL